jgi:hypothetical protein
LIRSGRRVRRNPWKRGSRDSELENRDNGKDQRARPELLMSIEASVGRAPLDWMLGAQ